MKPIHIFGKKLDIDQYLPCLKAKSRTRNNQFATDNQVEDESTTTLLRNCCVFFLFFVVCISIASIVAVSIVGTYKVVKMVTSNDNKIYTPFRTVNHGIWPGYSHEFFDDRLPFLKAEQVCLSRNNASLLSMNSKDQEDKFDMYVSLNFWNENDYPAFQLWTSGLMLARQLNSSTPVIWPEVNVKEDLKIRECRNRGEGLINAFGTSLQFWQERHIVKDYIPINQPPVSILGQTGCWQHIKRNDLTPESFYRFVCVRRIK